MNFIFVINITNVSTYKKLAGDTVIYGMSSIIGRFLNWWLVPYYSFIFAPETYGVVTNLYAMVAFLLVLLAYGMETSYFRYASRSENKETVYSTSIISLFITSVTFVLLAGIFRHEIANAIQYPNHPEYIVWFAVILGIDVFSNIPFARLRLKNKPLRFAFIKIINISFNIGFNIFFLTICPRLIEHNPESIIKHIYSPEIGVGYVFISNLLTSVITLVMLFPEIFQANFRFDIKLLRQMLSYGFPILIVGLAGMVNQNIDKIIMPYLIPDAQNPMHQVGIYGANYKLAVIMNMFIQAFRYAFEPFFFSRANTKDDSVVYATVMKYFVIAGLLIFLGMILYIDFVKIIIDEQYHEGLKVVPLVLMANLFFGIYFALSLWYKLTDKTRYGAYIAVTGAIITLILNFLLIPVLGYTGSAIAGFVCFLVMMVISYFYGQKYYPIPYNLKRIGTYFIAAAVIYILSSLFSNQAAYIKIPVNTILLAGFVYTIFYLEKAELKSMFKFSKNK
jgi:O-antigen/teichoic acid export membrane protein